VFTLTVSIIVNKTNDLSIF